MAFLPSDGNAADEFARRRLVPLRVIALLKSGFLEEAISTAAEICAIDPSVASLLPLQQLVDEAKLLRQRINDKLSLAILFDQYLERYVDDDVFQLMQFAYEDYLQSSGVQRPSELVGLHRGANSAKLIYFLRNIAVPDVMDVSFWLFKRSRDTARRG